MHNARYQFESQPLAKTGFPKNVIIARVLPGSKTQMQTQQWTDEFFLTLLNRGSLIMITGTIK